MEKNMPEPALKSKNLWQRWITQSESGRPWFLKLVIVVGISAFAAALALYAYLGVFSRYYADDYCLTSDFFAKGFWNSIIGLYLGWSNRFALPITVNISEYFGRSAIQAWPAFVIVLWVAAMTWALVEAVRLSRLKVWFGTALLLAEALIFFTILEAPQQYQSLYWRVGLVTYTLPLVFLAFLLGFIFNRIRTTSNGRIAWWGPAVCALLAFFAGGYSETHVALQTALLGMAVAGIWLGMKSPAKRNWLVFVGAALAGSLLALVVVIFAPGNAVRLAAIPTSRPHLPALIHMSISSAALFMYISLKDYAFQNVIALLLPMGMIYALYARDKSLPRMRPASLPLALFLIPIVGYVLIVAMCAPSAYGESSYPEARALIAARFIMVAMTVAEGGLIGLSFSQLHLWADEPAPLFLQISSAVLFLVLAAYPLYDARKSYAEIPVYQARAEVWDARAALVHNSLQQGITEINVHDALARSFDAFSGLMEIGSDPRYWVNSCAAKFFGIHALAINQPAP
jgi:hypothetical protein